MSASKAERWEDRALCRMADPNLFHPAGVGTAAREAYLPAKAWCARCPVREDCLEDAMAIEGDASSKQRHGVYGGLAPAERAALYLRREDERIEECAA